MINGFKERETRDSAIIYNTTWQQIKDMHTIDQAMAGELAISAIEMMLTGDISSDNPMIKLILRDMELISAKNKSDHERKVEINKTKRMEEHKLGEMATLYLQGLTQKEIGARLGITQQKVSYWLGEIRKDYPQLLTQNTQNTKNTNYDNVNVNVNDNDNDNVNDNACAPSRPRCSALDAPAPQQAKNKEFNF